MSRQEIIDQKNSEYDDYEAENKVKNRFVKRKNAKYLGKPRAIEIDTDKSKGKEKRYIRHKDRAENALAIANYTCEVDPSHTTFKRRRNPEVNYTESHHLILMGKQELFEYTLDTEENIVSICSNCHNCIHYGNEAGDIIRILYSKRKDLLKSAGIDIELDALLKMYGIDE